MRLTFVVKLGLVVTFLNFGRDWTQGTIAFSFLSPMDCIVLEAAATKAFEVRFETRVHLALVQEGEESEN